MNVGYAWVSENLKLLRHYLIDRSQINAILEAIVVFRVVTVIKFKCPEMSYPGKYQYLRKVSSARGPEPGTPVSEVRRSNHRANACHCFY